MQSFERDMLKELLDYDGDRQMSDWELDFLESMNRLMDLPLSDKQSNRLQAIWDKIFK